MTWIKLDLKSQILTKKCSKCGKVKPIIEFTKQKRGRFGVLSWCKDCIKSYRYTYQQTDKGKQKIKEYQTKYGQTEEGKIVHRRCALKHRNKLPYRFWAKNTYYQHSRGGFNVLISKEELESLAKESTNCPYCGTELKWTYGNGYQPNSPTLDRINNENYITLENTRIVCNQCNRTKGERTHEEFVKYCYGIAQVFSSQKGKT